MSVSHRLYATTNTDNIGTSQMTKEIEDKVMKVARYNPSMLITQSGVELFLQRFLGANGFIRISLSITGEYIQKCRLSELAEAKSNRLD